jgi:PAS domain S-box-containing protein
VAITNICRDVTLEDKLHAELEASEKKYRFLFNAGNDAIFVYRLTKERRLDRFVEANELACRLTGYTKEELMELTPVDLVVPEEREAVNESNLEISRKKQRVFERTLLAKDGRRIPCEISSHLFEMNGQPTILAIARDITERKKAEESLRAALREKDVMLKEIHHRVKNNMQVMSSLLRLQAAQLTDRKAREAFRKSQTRIQSMAMIHEKLYQSGNLASVDFADYVDKLVTHLFVVYEVNPGQVSFMNEVGQVGLDVNQAIPCGLIVNELVSNALKHAFRGSKKGELTVRLYEDGEGRHHLVVKDNGTPLSEKINIHKSRTLGFQIINDLTGQLDGTLEYRRNGGNEFEITF